MHAEYGGITSARHLVAYRNVNACVFRPGTPLRRVLAHVIDPAAPTHAVEVCAPVAREVSNTSQVPLWEGSHLRCEGLLDVSVPNPSILCRSVFKKSGWVTRSLIPHEVLRAFDVPLY